MNEGTSHPPAANGFVDLLRQEFKARARNNPRYSLRAFANLLKVDSSHLAKVIKGNRTVSHKFVEWAGASLNWGRETIDHAKACPDVSSSNSGRKFRVAVDRRLSALPPDYFEMMSELVHYTILEVTELTNFKATPKHIATRLRMPLVDVSAAVQRLKRLGALAETKEGILRTVKHFTTIKTPGTTVALKRLQQEILERAIRALREIDVEQRDQSAITMAINSAKLPEAKELIKKFRRELASLLQEGEARDRVYQLSISLFPLEQGDL